MAKGGKRPGSGRPKGAVAESTIIKRQASQRYSELVCQIAEDLFAAQKELALGVTVQEPDKDGGLRVYTKPPCSRTLTDMLDRAVTGKPMQSVELAGKDGADIPVVIRHEYAKP